MNYYSISYDLHINRKKSKINYNNKLRQYICCLLRKSGCDDMVRHTGSTIHFTSEYNFEFLKKFFDANVGKKVTISLDEIKKNSKTDRAKSHLKNRNPFFENNFQEELLFVWGVNSKVLEEKIEKHSIYFG